MEEQILELANGSWPVAVAALICVTALMLARMFKDDIAARIRGDAAPRPFRPDIKATDPQSKN